MQTIFLEAELTFLEEVENLVKAFTSGQLCMLRRRGPNKCTTAKQSSIFRLMITIFGVSISLA
ncbi:hypothetical protein WK53_22645 [Burkholderia ubonensis]|uniref:Uncharacterized protein n=1 Tax=Burkholderia ubonensis TaxID=101571 RepID=A0AAW3NKD6_9BURK|nr:hypothetical protein WK53_22645 [Burkholderia ubonensis]